MSNPSQKITFEKLIKSCLTLSQSFRLNGEKLDLKHDGKTYIGSKTLDVNELRGSGIRSADIPNVIDALNQLLPKHSSSNDGHFYTENEGSLLLFRGSINNVDAMLAEFELNIEERTKITADPVKAKRGGRG